MITVKRLYDVGKGGIVDYLIDSVADGPRTGAHAHFEGTAYYTEAGTPPGRWVGSGLAGLGDGAGLEAGSLVSADQLRALIEAGEDPITGHALGRRFTLPVSTADRVRAMVRALPASLSQDERQARVSQIEREVARTARSRAVHAFDFTFSPAKSVSVVWALGDAGVREQVEAAHRDAIAHVIELMEAHTIRTRLGSGGVVQAETRGIVAACFDHWDSRAGDPHLHTHMVVANRVQGPDGGWRTLDSNGALLPAQVALSEAYDNHLMDGLAHRLGVAWSVRSISRTGREHWEIDGVPDSLLEAFSTRHADIEQARGQVDGPGHWDADDRAWASTRMAKEHRSLAELTQQWRQRAAQVTDSPDPLRGVLGRPLPAPGTLAGAKGTRAHPVRAADMAEQDLEHLANGVIEALTASRPSWTMWNVRAEAQRSCRSVRMESPAQRDQVTENVAKRVVSKSVRVDHATRAHTPARYRRPDGSSRFVPQNTEIYTVQALIDAEDDLVRISQDTTGPRLESLGRGQLSAGGRQLSPDQDQAVRSVATSGRYLDVMVGPAGAGKTTALRALVEAWQAQGAAVTALAPSAAAAQVLGDSLGAQAENTAMWLTLRRADAQRAEAIASLRAVDEQLANGGRLRAVRDQLAAADPTIASSLGPLTRRSTARAAIASRLESLQALKPRAPLGAGDLLIIDEASMAATLPLHDIVTQARNAGAKVLTVGDPDQLAAIEAGGAFGMLVDRRDDVATLRTIHRFTDAWQATASLALRAGDRRAIELYASQGAIRPGELDQVLEEVHSAWRTETSQGATSLMIAADNATAAELARRARADLIEDGIVHGREVALNDGNKASAGDTVMTRLNARHLRSGHHWAHNGATWHVQAVSADGALLVTPTADPTAEAIHLPAAYVSEQVELAYATTIYRSQGRTVDHAHLVVDPTTGLGRQSLYVGMTRGRGRNVAHVVTDPANPTDDLFPTEPRKVQDILGEILSRSTAPLTARRAADQAADRAESIAQLADEYTTLAAGQSAWGWEAVLPELIPQHAQALLDDDWADSLAKELDRAARSGMDVRTILPTLATREPLDQEHPAADLAQRTRAARAGIERGPRRLIAGLIPAAPPAQDPDMARALAEREELINARAGKVLHTALSAGETWCTALGQPPSDPAARSAWLQAARTVAAYRDRWGVTTPRPSPGQDYDLGLEDPLGLPNASTNRIQAEDRRRATNALRRAQQISSGSPTAQVGHRGPGTRPDLGRAPGLDR